MAVEAIVGASFTGSQPEPSGVPALRESELNWAASDVPWSKTPTAAEKPSLLS